jgi:hypothetical protein
MRPYALIASTAFLIGCASHSQLETRPLTETIVHRSAWQEVPKYEYKVEGDWILGPSHQWPLNVGDHLQFPTKDAMTLLSDRWEGGAEATIKTRDSVAIRLVVFEHLPKRNRRIRALKQISQYEYMAEATWQRDMFHGGQSWFVLARSGSGYRLIEYYCIGSSGSCHP